MMHIIEIGVEMKSFDNNSIYKGEGMGPVKTQKHASFFGMGSDLDEALADAHKQLTEFISSDAVRIGASDKSRIQSPLSDFPQRMERMDKKDQQ